MKRYLIRFGVSLLAALFTAIPALAQTQAPAEGTPSINRGLGFLAAVVGLGIAAGLCGLGQGRVAAAACEGMARNPSAYNRIQVALFVGLALIESLVLFTLVVVLLVVFPNI
jgi:F-type H+-transporting ATPase subunit c